MTISMWSVLMMSQSVLKISGKIEISGYSKMLKISSWATKQCSENIWKDTCQKSKFHRFFFRSSTWTLKRLNSFWEIRIWDHTSRKCSGINLSRDIYRSGIARTSKQSYSSWKKQHNFNSSCGVKEIFPSSCDYWYHKISIWNSNIFYL